MEYLPRCLLLGREVSAVPPDPGQLVRRQKSPGCVPGLLEEPQRLAVRAFGLLEVARTQEQEVGQAELARSPLGKVRGFLQKGVNCLHGPADPHHDVVGPVVDHPLGPPRHRRQDLQPAVVVGRQQLDKRSQDRQRLTVCLPPLGLAQAFPEGLDRLPISDLGRPSEVGGRLPETI